MKISKKVLLATATVVITSSIYASAQVITPLNPLAPVVVNSVPNSSEGPALAPSTGTGGYYFFAVHTDSTGKNSDVNDVPSYVTNVDYDLTSYNVPSGKNVTTLEYPGSYSQLDINGTEYGTGELYYNVGGNGITNAPMVKLTLGSGVPQNFDLGLLQQDNTNETLIVSLYDKEGDLLNSADASASLVSGKVGSNEFYYTEVSGAISTDYLVVSGTGYYQTTLGGVTFDDVPEPTTCVLSGLGIVLLLIILRNRRSVRA